MNIDFNELLHPRIIEHCVKLIEDGHFKQAAHTAMIQVEKAIKEKVGEEKKYGSRLIKNVFGGDEVKAIKLQVPFGENRQKQAEQYFTGVFSFYRNYSAHDGDKIDAVIAKRCLVLASDLLDLIGASRKSFSDVGGIDGLIKLGVFKSKSDLQKILVFFQKKLTFPIWAFYETYFHEDFAEVGCGEDQLDSLIDIGMIEFKEATIYPSYQDMEFVEEEEVGWFELTDLGNSTLQELSESA